MKENTPLRFAKMHGLGNDFVVVDLRDGRPRPSAGVVRRLADRHFGIGFDQLALIEAAPAGEAADLALVFFNPDGSESSACGNATRCIAAAEMDATGRDRLAIRTGRGLLAAERRADGLVHVNMGQPLTAWQEIPLLEAMDTLELPIEGTPVATGMGNPHCTFFVEDAEIVPLERFGPRYEHHPLFPERTNVEVAQVIDAQTLRLRIWERGTGVTFASGSCACAAAVAAVRRGLTGQKVTVRVDGGTLHVDWRDDGVWLAGATAHVFDAVLRPGFLEDGAS